MSMGILRTVETEQSQSYLTGPMMASESSLFDMREGVYWPFSGWLHADSRVVADGTYVVLQALLDSKSKRCDAG